MKKRIRIWGLLLVLALCLVGCGGKEGPEGAQGQDSENSDPGNDDTEGNGEDDPKEDTMEQYENQVKVMSYNIYYKDMENRAANIWDLVLKNDPDVLLLQEVSLDWVPFVQEFLADSDYSYYGYGRYGGEMSEADLKTGEQFVPVLWKTSKYDLVDSGHFWLSSTPEVYSAAWTDGVISNYPRCQNWVILKDKETGGELLVMPVHTDPESSAVRTNSSKLIVEKAAELAAGRPVVMGGDWNMGITEYAYEVITDSGYRNARFVAAVTTDKGSYNSWGSRAEDDYLLIDHIFISENMGAASYEVLDDLYDGEHASDHCPIQAVLGY